METNTEKAAFTIDESCVYLSISRPTLYRIMEAKEIRNFHIGRRRLILKTDLDLFIETQFGKEAAWT